MQPDGCRKNVPTVHALLQCRHVALPDTSRGHKRRVLRRVKHEQNVDILLLRPSSPPPGATSFNACNETLVREDCGVCSSGFGQGVGNTCHACTAGFEAGMFTLVALAALVALLGALLIAVYLVSRAAASDHLFSSIQ